MRLAPELLQVDTRTTAPKSLQRKENDPFSDSHSVFFLGRLSVQGRFISPKPHNGSRAAGTAASRDPEPPSPPSPTYSSFARLIKCGKESDGKKTGTFGAKIGNVHLKRAFSEAAVCFLEHNPTGQAFLQRLQRKHSKGKALSVLAAKLGRATYFILKQQTTFDMNRFVAIVSNHRDG